jgi:hypothetical protein
MKNIPSRLITRELCMNQPTNKRAFVYAVLACHFDPARAGEKSR